jgi:hypothetical protein
VERPRTERWLTWPWRPWKKTRIYEQPMHDALVFDDPMGEKVIVMHPLTWRQYSGRA